jgi:HK97 family phage major capsid protein
MGRIKDLRDKIKSGEATDEDKVELEELETEAKEEAEETADEEKSMTAIAEKLLSIMEAKQKAKEVIVEEKTEVKETGFEVEYKSMDKEGQMEAFYKALIANDTAKLKVMTTSTTDGQNAGYLIPTVLYNEIVEEMRDDAVIRSRARVIPNCPATLSIDQLVGRPKASWTAEKAVKDTTTATFAQISLTPYTLACIAVMTNQLIQDAEAGGFFVSYMTEKIATAINEKEDQAFAAGSGSGQPTGIDSYAATVHRIITTPANVLTPDSLIDANYKLGTKYRTKAVWLMNTQTLTKAMQLKDSQNRYLFIADPTGVTPGTILGKPVLEQNDINQSHIWFGDLKSYWIGDRGGMTIAKSEEATIEGVGNLFERNMTAIRVEKRTDGELVDLDAFCVITGTN